MDSIEALRAQLAEFAAARDWDQFHSPRNLILALTGEVGELAEISQWRTDEELLDAAQDLKASLGEELADVAIYLIRLADRLEVDLGQEIENKIQANETRYDPETYKGSTRKAPPP